ncbi:unnamed protein product [Ixodes hexagonus]
MPMVKCLRGFCDMLDLRPILFEESVPDDMCCNMCDVISMLLMKLPCCHNYCEVCYTQLSKQTPTRCPLDQERYDSDSVFGSYVKVSALHKKKVRCVNFNEGCGLVETLGNLKEHFPTNCDFHPVTCRRCAQRMPQRELLLHLTHHCGSDCKLSQLSTINVEVGKVVERLSIAKCATEDNINSILACAQAYAKVTNDLRMLLGDSLPQICQAEKQIMQRVGSVAAFEPSSEGRRRASCLLRNFSAKLRSDATYTSDAFEVAGYPLQICQTYVKGFGDQLYVYLGLLTSVRTVENPSQWPVRKTFFLILVHPEDPSKNVKHAIMPTEVEDVHAYFSRIREKTDKAKVQRPLDKWFKTSRLLSDGFVVDDALRVTVETEG